MTDEELLITDLCARLPYGVKVAIGDRVVKLESIYTRDKYARVVSHEIAGAYLKNVKPCLFPMSSMTEEQREEYNTICNNEWCNIQYQKIDAMYKGNDWLNKHHFDYRGLIEKGLALDATNFDLNIYESN